MTKWQCHSENAISTNFQFCHDMQFSPLFSLPTEDFVCYNIVQSTMFIGSIAFILQ